MNFTQTLPSISPQTKERPAKALESPQRARLFYTGAAALLLLLMFLGFQQFYLHGRAYPHRELTPPLRTLLILHGCAMTAWMLVFLVQPLLIVSGNRRAHMMLGRGAAVLAAGNVFLGLRVAIEAARVNPPDLKIWGLVPNQLLAIPIISILLFALFVIAGVWYRRRPEVHRPMMLLSMLAVIPEAVSRIDSIRGLYSGTVWATIFGSFFGTLVIGLILLLLKRLLTRSWDRWLALGYAGLVVACALRIRDHQCMGALRWLPASVMCPLRRLLAPQTFERHPPRPRRESGGSLLR